MTRWVNFQSAATLWHKLRASLLAINSARWIKCQCLLAEICARSTSADIGLEILESIPEDQRQAFIAPELLRLEGELLLKKAHPSVEEAKLRFEAAVDLAKARNERALELRAATSLARLLNGSVQKPPKIDFASTSAARNPLKTFVAGWVIGTAMEWMHRTHAESLPQMSSECLDTTP